MIHVCDAVFLVELFYDRQVKPPAIIIYYNYVECNIVVLFQTNNLSLPIVFPEVFLVNCQKQRPGGYRPCR